MAIIHIDRANLRVIYIGLSADVRRAQIRVGLARGRIIVCSLSRVGNGVEKRMVSNLADWQVKCCTGYASQDDLFKRHKKPGMVCQVRGRLSGGNQFVRLEEVCQMGASLTGGRKSDR